MEKSTIQLRQEEALQAYERVGDTQAAIAALQAAMLAEIALQLQQQNEHLEFIASALDMLNIWGRIGVPVHMADDK